MDFTTNEDHDSLRATLRDFLGRAGTEEQVRRIMGTPTGHDRGLWTQLADDLGLTSIGVPEELGGAGFGFAELTVVLTELGRTLLPSPMFATRVLAVETLLLSADPAVSEEIETLVSGRRLGALALTDHPGGWDPARIGVLASARGDGYVLDGAAGFVIDGASADLLIVAAKVGDGLGIFLVDADAAGVATQVLETVDLTRRQASHRFTAAPARRIRSVRPEAEVLSEVLDRAVIALAAEQVGGAERCLDLAVHHAKSRIQFGRPIGTFQAIKHKCADVLLELDAARTAVRAAAWSIDHDPDQARLLAPMVKAHCSEMYLKAARECIQIHGGMGFTWEFTAQLYFKRAHSSSLMLGIPQHHREELVRRLGIDAQADETRWSA